MDLSIAAFLARLHDVSRPPLVMGVLNLTPDSFSDGGRFVHAAEHTRVDAALVEARRMVAEGAELLDLGGESTRPGAVPVDEGEELRRVLPVLEALAAEGTVHLSVDTQRASLARRAADVGAVLVNDVGAGGRDPLLWPLVAERGLPYVLMHMQGTPRRMQEDPCYEDVAQEVGHFLADGTRRLMALGLPKARIVLDPGIGFGKTLAHNRALLRALAPVEGQAYLLGASRKRFIAGVEEEQGLRPSAPTGRLGGSVAAALWGARCGARILRVHDVAETVQALRLWRWLEG